ncbi:hypothetical protein KQ878_02920 [Mycoplasma zalophidermidis]|uniref:Transposase n=1 Tax=Mycoplasma zalophidermidis TaxID=398174 RepID=A0ABS6DS29_9MOLU|nr:hypothetical protein [Mycoplasma zalophidermidis]MBU4689890.1 hypothetical protein [Mycoplasma zalophidermidis]MBU4693819.1 hypothetical protein [Mycoplasma zalophidermidis]
MKIFTDTNKTPLYFYETYTTNDDLKLTNQTRASIIKSIISKYYITNTETKIYLLSDGAVYFKNLATLLSAKHIYDYYHFKKRFNEIFKKKLFVYSGNKKSRVWNNKQAKKWLYNSLNDKKTFLYKLDYLAKSDLLIKSKRKVINNFIKFIYKNCKNLEFHINSITAQAETTISLYKAIYRKRYSIFSLKTLINLININKNTKCNFVDFKLESSSLKNVEFEPIIWANNQNYHWV